MKRLALACSLALVFACNAGEGPVSFRDAWVRLPPPGANTAAYLEIHNPRSETLRITGVLCDAVDRIEIHRSMRQGGMASMEPIEAIEVPPKGRVALEPGGLHLMLIRPHDLVEGDSLEIVFTLEDGSRLPVLAKVRR